MGLGLAPKLQSGGGGDLTVVPVTLLLTLDNMESRVSG